MSIQNFPLIPKIILKNPYDESKDTKNRSKKSALIPPPKSEWICWYMVDLAYGLDVAKLDGCLPPMAQTKILE